MPTKSVAALMLSLAACALDHDDPAESTTASALCSVFYCGDNTGADAGDGLLFDELDLFHRANYAGVRMLEAWRPAVPGVPGVQVTLDVQGHTLRGYGDDGSILEGGGLINTMIKMEYVNGSTTEIFELLIAGFDQSAVQFEAGAHDYIPHYLIKARRPAKKQKEFIFVCNRNLLTADPMWAQVPHHALIYRGDRYVPGQKRVRSDNDPSDGWSFLACAGSAGAKLHVFRHTHAGAFDRTMSSAPYMTLPDQRTILLKAITADLCGNGSTFTISGQPLAFTAAAGFAMPPVNLTVAPPPPPWPWPRPPGYGVRSTEAIWDINGAVCIDHPRRERGVVSGDPQWSRTEINNLCGRTIYDCGFLMAGWSSSGYAVTANPW